ncbi:MAG: glutathione S-transferase N-terminal domain-containing protein [Alphaproteobacteria bacterium]|nr:glutathione S-transferase N-terminal domain-containing protein [Alphaproteobacteria bacterium]
MIDLYTWATPNGRKVSILLEELGLDYRVHVVDIGTGDQFAPDYVAINPNGKIPAIIDRDATGGAVSVFESGAILVYLAQKTGRFLPTEPRRRYAVLEWLMLQVGSIGPMLGQAQHFRRFAPQSVPYAIGRYTQEAGRLYGVLDRRLAEQPFLGGAEYSIADVATYPWIARHEWQGQALQSFPDLQRWFQTVGERPAVQRGVRVPVL